MSKLLSRNVAARRIKTGKQLPSGCIDCNQIREVKRLKKELKDAQENLTTAYMSGAADLEAVKRQLKERIIELMARESMLF
jgi:hypothetical protein